MKTVAVLVCGAAALAALIVAVAHWRGRESRPWRWASQLIAPVVPAPRVPEPLALPFESDFDTPLDWRWFKRDDVRILTETPELTLETTTECVWYMNSSGPMVWTLVEGDVDMTVAVRVRSASDPDQPPDHAYQFGGLMLRDPAGDAFLSLEDYVFNVVGHRGDELVIETKSTERGRSLVEAYPWRSGDAHLRIRRNGDAFQLFARASDREPWVPVREFVRPDLPDSLQAGLIVYSYDYGGGRFDLRATFDELRIERPGE